MGGKLEGPSEVFIPEIVLADNCRIDAHKNADFVSEPGKIYAGSDRAYEGRFSAAFQQTGVGFYVCG